ncbi:1099_t:CDS:1, partial [Gigaspora margarita]
MLTRVIGVRSRRKSAKIVETLKKVKNILKRTPGKERLEQLRSFKTGRGLKQR